MYFLLPLDYESIEVCNIFKGIHCDMAHTHPAVTITQNPNACLVTLALYALFQITLES